MFDFLSQASTEQATNSVYYATRLIRHVKHIKGAKDGLRVKDLKSEPTANDELLAKRIISEIETNEQSSLADLDELKAKEYIQQLADVLQSVLKNNLKYDESRGRELLKELREDKSYTFATELYQGIRHLSKFTSRISRWISYGGLLASLLTFLYGIKIASLITGMRDGVDVDPQQQNATIIEGIIAILNILLAIIVLIDIRYLHPIKIANDNSSASNSFKQLLKGWQLLWITWILFYGCLAVQWFHLIDNYPLAVAKLDLISALLNMVNGFFFYYLFFVLDQPSVDTEIEPDRAKSFRRNWIATLILGIILFSMPSIPLLSSYAEKGILSKLIPAYIAVGMAFFVGRLDSHYLRLPRVILAPLYLYAVIQLFWDDNTFADNSHFNSDRVIIFSVALILKFVIFLVLSKLIRHQRFHQYFVIAEKGLREGY